MEEKSNENKEINILLAEDDEFIRDIYSRIFTMNGYNVIIANNGIEAMEKLEKNAPDLILLDIMMPYMNGKEVFKKIKASDKLKNIPVVFLTNVSAQDDIEQELLEQADKYLIKAHFTPKEVIEEVTPLINKNKKI
ncbi:MAG: response regulator [Candidatus Moranbacteria bacterium]|jgi:twitching motility two-component system response regulator PilH|nr:response regulator [Candidatus Moranbacteria bacterium]MDD5652340.1 response regulator [Candidatus Moranbacteria bacterium]MDX9855390.1 response regulator [Candidatus Moranbacteria bacterium]